MRLRNILYEALATQAFSYKWTQFIMGFVDNKTYLDYHQTFASMETKIETEQKKELGCSDL